MIFERYLRNENSQILNEANIISYEGKPNFSVDVVPEPNRGHGGKDAYFKYTSGNSSYSSGETETRISFREPSYVKHPKGKPHKNLSSKEKKNLVIQFNKPNNKKDGKGLTNWEYAIHRFNMSNNTSHLENEDQANAEVRAAVKSGDYIPLNYPMPDYTKL